ncbi:MAG TPA: hypothetical protein VF414_18090, partial [Thermoanaerobaculia bacterium]
MLRACLEEAAQPDLGPFVEALAPGVPAGRQAAVLRLVRGRSDPRLETRVRALAASPDPDVRALAGQIVSDLASRHDGTAGEPGAIFVFHHPEDRELGCKLSRELQGQGWLATTAAEDPSWKADPEELVRTARGGVVVVREGAVAPWEERGLANCLKMFVRHHRPLVLAKLFAGGGGPSLPGDLSLA